MEQVAAPVGEARARARLEQRLAVVRIRRRFLVEPRAVVDVAEDVERAHGIDRARHARRGVVEVVAPHAHVLVAALDLEAVIPRHLHAVAVDVAVLVREARGREVVLAAHAVVEMVLAAVDLVPAVDVIAAAVAEGDALGARGVAIGPAVGGIARIVDPVALDRHARELLVHADRADPRVHVGSPLAVARASPAAHVVVLDDHVVHVLRDEDAVLLRALQREAAHDHVRGVDGDVVRRCVQGIERGAGAVVHDVAAGAAARGDVQRRSAVLHLDGLRNRHAVRPGGERDSPDGSGARQVHLHFVGRSRREIHERAATFVRGRVVPEVEALTPARRALHAELHFTARGGIGAGARPVEADGFICRNRTHAARRKALRRRRAGNGQTEQTKKRPRGGRL